MTSIAALLALPEPDTAGPLAIARHVARGLPVSSADHMRDVLRSMTARDLHEVVPEATLRRARKQNRPLSKDASERLYDMARVLSEAEDLFGDEAKARRFMERPSPFLDGASPFALTRSSTAGADAVIQFIGQIRAGVAA